jgi:hypothetical protein
MRLFNFLAGILLFCFVSSATPTTINGKFTIVNINSSQVSILLQINTNTGTDDLGGATIVFNLDTSVISFTGNPVKNVDYVFHNFCGGNYSSATVTRPMNDKIWVNIDLPFTNNNTGTVVAGNPGWTDVVTIHFDIVNPNGTASLVWLTTSPFWGTYDADNSTLWDTGNFEDLNGSLPVEIVSFKATLLVNENVLLEWVTASSLNNSGFEIEKSYKNSGRWENIGFVENHGDPTSLVEYSFTDKTYHNFPIVRYRLKTIDHDGSFKYSDVIEINIVPIKYELSQNYPNPFNPSTKIRFSVPSNDKNQKSNVILKVYDILGNEVAILVDEEKDPGIYEVEFSRSDLASGIYIYQLKADNFTSIKKMVFLR